MRRIARLSVFLFAVIVVAGAAGDAKADEREDENVVGIHDNNVSAQVCHNQIPINILGIQIPIHEIAASIGLPIASDDSPAEGPDDSCNQSSAGGENEGSAGRDSGEREMDQDSGGGDTAGDADGTSDEEEDGEDNDGLLDPIFPN